MPIVTIIAQLGFLLHTSSEPGTTHLDKTGFDNRQL